MKIVGCLPFRRKRKNSKAPESLKRSESPPKGEHLPAAPIPSTRPHQELQLAPESAELQLPARRFKGTVRKVTMCLVSVALWKAASAKSMASKTLAAVRTSPSSNEIRGFNPSPPPQPVRDDHNRSTPPANPSRATRANPSRATLIASVSMPDLTKANATASTMVKCQSFGASPMTPLPSNQELQRPPYELHPSKFFLALLAASVGLLAGSFTAVIVTTSCLYMIPRLAAAWGSGTSPAKVESSEEDRSSRFSSKEYHKTVIIKGLLQRTVPKRL